MQRGSFTIHEVERRSLGMNVCYSHINSRIMHNEIPLSRMNALLVEMIYLTLLHKTNHLSVNIEVKVVSMPSFVPLVASRYSLLVTVTVRNEIKSKMV
jgi:hypothetical protein